MKYINLSQGKQTIVDDCDYDSLNQYKWSAQLINKYWYAVRNDSTNGYKNRKRVYMHRSIMSCPDELVVDHIDHNTLDNRRVNLRICSRHQNCSNALPIDNASSKYRGVYWLSRDNMWMARITCRGTRIYLGMYEYEDDAAIAYNMAATELHKEFAVLNKV